MTTSAIVRTGLRRYPEPPFDPPVAYPELASLPWCRSLAPANGVYAGVRASIIAALDGEASDDPATLLRRYYGPVRNIVVKPNWVREEAPYTGCITTSGSVIRVVVDLALAAFGPDARVLVGDVPLQSARLPTIWEQTGVEALRRMYADNGAPVEFRDLRRETAITTRDGFIERIVPLPGDPAGYREVRLGASSYLEAVTGPRTEFSVDDYEPGETGCHHVPGRHSYLIAGSVLDADLVINLPKLKTHCKAGLTGCMKNLIGINGDKGWIPHYRMGSSGNGGDEYASDAAWLVAFRTRLRDALQGRNRMLYAAASRAWRRFRSTVEAVGGPSLTAGGAWPGNDTLWRSILDLHRVLLFADRQGALTDRPQRHVLCVVDAIVAGEGEGPLAARPRPLGVVIAGRNPIAVDLTCARLAGVPAERTPQMRSALSWARENRPLLEFDEPLQVRLDDAVMPLAEIPILGLRPPKGWESVFAPAPTAAS